MDNIKWNFIITLRTLPAASVIETFKQLQILKEMGVATDLARISFNGTTLVAGIYENGEQYLATHVGVLDGDKKRIIENLPASASESSIGIALLEINNELEKRHFEKFSDREINRISNRYRKLEEEETKGPQLVR